MITCLLPIPMNTHNWTPTPSFSFLLDGKPAPDFASQPPSRQEIETTPGGRLEHLEWAGPGGLKITAHLRRFDDFPALDWFLEFENTGPQDSPLLEDLLPLDARFPLSPASRLRLHHANGSLCQVDDFLPLLTGLVPGGRKELKPMGGRSSNGVLPFMNVQRPGGGLVIAVGWSGQWSANFERSQDALHITAGMERTRLRLHPGEKIRTPRILLLPWQGFDMETGQNLLRRLLLAHYLPRLDGQLVMPPAAQCLQFYFYYSGQAGEAYEARALPRAAALGTDAYWIDACWFGGEGQWWEEVGTWDVNPARFPHSIRPISDAARAAGMKFVLWFEPERARPRSRLAREHPEFFLRTPANPDNLLYNLGDPSALAFLIDLLSTRIAELGVDIYRQDFNFDPLPYWQAADSPGRVGMAEIRYIEGLYALWDELRQRNPGLWIDNCASGGRRIDLETASRALPLWPSDFHDVVGFLYGLDLHVGDQCINAGLARWLPLFGGGVWNFTPYGTRSEIIGGFMFGYHLDHAILPSEDRESLPTANAILSKGKTLLDDDFPLDAARAAIQEWKSLRPFFLGDFYLLLPLTVSSHDWCAWQLHRPDLRAGVAIAFRRHRSPFPAMEIALNEIDPQAEYEVSLSPGYLPEPSTRLPGWELASLLVSIPEKPGSVLVRYRQVS